MMQVDTMLRQIRWQFLKKSRKQVDRKELRLAPKTLISDTRILSMSGFAKNDTLKKKLNETDENSTFKTLNNKLLDRPFEVDY